MKPPSSLRWVGWSVLASAISMIASVVFSMIALSMGWITLGTHSHSVLVETFDVLTTGFLLPLPIAFHWIYRSNAPHLSLFSMLLGTITLLAGTVLHILFVFEVLWFSDWAWVYLYGGAGFSLWLIGVASLAYKNGKPRRGTLLNLIGASVVGFPVWAFWLGYLLASGKLTDRPAA